MPKAGPREKSSPPRTARPWIDAGSVALLLTAMVAIIASVISLRLAMDGGFLGIFCFLCMGPLLVIPVAFAARALIAGSPRYRWRRFWSIIALLPMLPLCFLSLADSISTWRSNPVCDLSSLPGKGKYAHTRIEFQQGENQSVVHDPHNKIRFCFGGGPDEARIEADHRILVFHHGVILKTWVSDLEFTNEGIGIGGWMGAGLPHGEMQVSEQGVIEECP